MRRADRLFQIVQILRRGRLETAASLALRLEVSERTVYRDIRDLIASGVPVDGEAGVGYVLRPGYDLPPLMFSRSELEALTVAARMLRAWAGGALGNAIASALDKVESVLPADRRGEPGEARHYVPDVTLSAELRHRLDTLRDAIHHHRVVEFDYVRADGASSRRTARPLGLFFWGAVWTLGAWCELRCEFRTFRIDRMGGVGVLERGFEDVPGQGIDDYIALSRRDGADA